MHRITIVIYLEILLSLFCYGQKNVLYVHELSTQNGLSQSSNNFLKTDQYGFTWISSLDGLNLFDGKNVKIFKEIPNDSNSMKGGNIQSTFFMDSIGNTWFTTGVAINCYNRNKGNFIFDYAGGTEDEFAGVHYAFHFEKKRYLWVTNNDRLYRYDTKLAKSQSISRAPIIENFDAARCAIEQNEDTQNITIYGCFWKKSGFEIIQLSKNKEIKSRKSWFDTPDSPYYPLIIHQVLANQVNEAWFATNKGVLFFNHNDPSNYKLIPLPHGTGKINSIAHFSKNLLWVASDSSEIFILDKKKKVFLSNTIQLLNVVTRKKLKTITKIFPIQDSILWVYSKGAGVYYANLANQKFTSLFDNNELEEQSVNRIYKDLNDRVWCTSHLGTAWIFIDKALVRKQNVAGYLKRINDFDGQVWEISTKGLTNIKYLNRKTTIVYPIKNAVFLSDIVSINYRYLLIGTNNGIKFFDKKSKQTIDTKNKDWTVGLFLDSKKRLWSADTEGTLILWEINGTSIFEKINFPNLGVINDIIEDNYRQCIWVGTSKGLLKIHSKTFEINNINELDGLENQFIYSIIQDKKDRIWLSTNKGISRYIPEENEFKNFTSRSGLSANEYSQDAALLSQNGEIWFGSTKGVDVFHPDSINEIGQAPKLAISSLKINNVEWKGNTSINSIQKLNLSYKQNTLTFDLAAMEYTDPLSNKFKVYLTHGEKRDSSYLGAKNSITYANLSPGEYSFQFTACNADGIWQKEKYNLEIYIKPHFTQTGWFRALILSVIVTLISLGLIIYYRYKLRKQQMEAETQRLEAERNQLVLEKELSLQRERNRIAKDMHDELGGGLSTIYYASERARKKGTLKEVFEILNRVSAVSTNLIESMRGIIWAMDTSNDSLENLVAYIRRYTRCFLDDNNLAATINIPENLPKIVVSGQYRHNIHLVVKESLHNILKHSKANKVTFDLTIEKNLEISITDNGIGFDPELKKNTGVGLRSMSKRMKAINGTIEWKTLPMGGTSVNISVSMIP